MKLLTWMKDGGPESRVWGFFLIEWKRFFSVALLMFKDGSREAYHSHAFNALSWVLKGELTEDRLLEKKPGFTSSTTRTFKPSLKPIWTSRTNMHKVSSTGTTFVLSVRGPWAKTWMEYLPIDNQFVMLTNGRQELVRMRDYHWLSRGAA